MRRFRAGLAAVFLAPGLPAAAADALPAPPSGTTIVWAEPGDPRPVMTWTVTGSAGGVVEIVERDDGSERGVAIADGIFPLRQGGGTARFDRARLEALRPLEPARVATFDAEETGPEGTARWFVHVAVTDRLAIEVPAGRFEVVVVEHHRRGTDADGAAAESVAEWSVAPAIGLPVAMRAWRIAGGRPELTADLRAAAIRLP